MTQITFYVCKQNTLKSRLLLACRLTEKAREHGLSVYIHTDSAFVTERLDEYLWAWSDTSFIPHAIAPDADVNVLLGDDYTPEAPRETCDYLINLSNTIPPFFARFKRIAEILDPNDENLRDGRQRYRFYQDKGYQLDYHKL